MTTLCGKKFTTKPYVDNGTFRIIGECPTPWPCFVIAVRNEVLENEEECVKNILKVINNITSNFKNTSKLDQIISKRYGQKLADVKQWLSLTEWSQDQISEIEVEKIQEKLLKLDLIDSKVLINKLLHFL